MNPLGKMIFSFLFGWSWAAEPAEKATALPTCSGEQTKTLLVFCTDVRATRFAWLSLHYIYINGDRIVPTSPATWVWSAQLTYSLYVHLLCAYDCKKPKSQITPIHPMYLQFLSAPSLSEEVLDDCRLAGASRHDLTAHTTGGGSNLIFWPNVFAKCKFLCQRYMVLGAGISVPSGINLSFLFKG